MTKALSQFREQKDISSEHGPKKAKYKAAVNPSTQQLPEQHADEGKFKPVKPKMIQNTPIVSPRATNDSANVKLKEEEMKLEEEIAGWIAHYNGQKHEIKKHEAKDLYDAKQKAIAHFKAPKSKHGLIAVKPAYNEAVETPQPKSDQDKWKEEYKKARAAGSSSSNAKARANGAVYEEEQLDELSKDTLKSYRVKSIGRAGEFENRGYEAAKRGGAGSDKADKLFNKADAVTTARKRAQEKMREEVEQVEEGAFKRIATDAEEDKRLGSWKKETPWMPSKGTVTDKSGAKHTPMSRARDLARAAAKKNVKESVSITESRLADIVREAAESAKKKKKEEKAQASDKFQANPELTTQIIKND